MGYSQKKRKQSRSRKPKVKPEQAEAIVELADSVAKTEANEEKIEEVVEQLEKLQKKKGMKDLMPIVAAAAVAMGIVATARSSMKGGRVRKLAEDAAAFEYRARAGDLGKYAWSGAARHDAIAGIRSRSAKLNPYTKYKSWKEKRAAASGSKATPIDPKVRRDAQAASMAAGNRAFQGRLSQYGGKYRSGMASPRLSARASRVSQRKSRRSRSPRRRRRSRSR